jgi:hypothetical protein
LRTAQPDGDVVVRGHAITKRFGAGDAVDGSMVASFPPRTGSALK